MNQPPNPAPPRGDRPQLFNAPSAAGKHARRHADFGPSILATIDGGQGKSAASRSRLPARQVLFVGAAVLVAAASYVGVKFNAERTPALPGIVAVQAPVAAAVAPKPIDMPASAVQVAGVVPGAAAIETVTPPAPAPAASTAADKSAHVAASVNSIQLALDRAEPEVAPVKKEPAVRKAAVATRGAAPAAAPRPATQRASASADNDADLLAAMLPHLKRVAVVPGSPAYDKRCGKLTGEAAADCRAKFCNGRAGADAACPMAVDTGGGSTSRARR